MKFSKIKFDKSAIILVAAVLALVAGLYWYAHKPSAPKPIAPPPPPPPLPVVVQPKMVPAPPPSPPPAPEVTGFDEDGYPALF